MIFDHFGFGQDREVHVIYIDFEMQGTAVGRTEAVGTSKEVLVRKDDFEETEHGLILRAHHHDNLLGVFIPWRSVLSVKVFSQDNVPGYA